PVLQPQLQTLRDRCCDGSGCSSRIVQHHRSRPMWNLCGTTITDIRRRVRENACCQMEDFSSSSTCVRTARPYPECVRSTSRSIRQRFSPLWGLSLSREELRVSWTERPRISTTLWFPFTRSGVHELRSCRSVCRLSS